MRQVASGFLVLFFVLGVFPIGAVTQRVTNAEVDLQRVPPLLTLYGIGFGAEAGTVYMVIEGVPVPLDPVGDWTESRLQAVLPTTRPGTYAVGVRAPGKPLATIDLTLGVEVQVAHLAPPAETGQHDCWDQEGILIPCGGTGQDGDVRAGVKWPEPRFVDRQDGTVLDRLTGLVWLRDWECFGTQFWDEALAIANQLADGQCGLSGGYRAGDFVAPNIKELESLIDYGSPTVLPEGHPFNFHPGDVWSSTTYQNKPERAWTFGVTTPFLYNVVPKVKNQGNRVVAIYRPAS